MNHRGVAPQPFRHQALSLGPAAAAPGSGSTSTPIRETSSFASNETLAMQGHRDGGGQLARHDQVIVNVCGRSVAFQGGCGSLMELQAQLQDELGMPDQVFEVFDVSGTRLHVDMDLREAFAEGRTPLSAALSDASIHFIENRREELAQMQWKLVRDQHNQASTKLSMFARQLTACEARLDQTKHTLEQSLAALRNELLSSVETLREVGRNDNRQLNERLAGVGQLIQAERNMREVALEQLNKSIQSIHDTIDGDRSAIQQGADYAMSHVDGARKLIEAERQARESLEVKQEQRVESLNERVNEVALSLRQSMEEYSKRFEKASLESSESVEQHTRKSQRHKNETETALEAQAARLKLLEERSLSVEARLSDQQRHHADHVEKISKRHEKVVHAAEQSKFDSTQNNLTVQSMGKKIQDLEAMLSEQDSMFREACERERRQRQDEFQSIREALNSEQQRLRAALEGKIASSIDNESAARQESISQILGTVGTLNPKLHDGLRSAGGSYPQHMLNDITSDASNSEMTRGDHQIEPANNGGSVPAVVLRAASVAVLPGGSSFAGGSFSAPAAKAAGERTRISASASPPPMRPRATTMPLGAAPLPHSQPALVYASQALRPKQQIEPVTAAVSEASGPAPSSGMGVGRRVSSPTNIPFAGQALVGSGHFPPAQAGLRARPPTAVLQQPPTTLTRHTLPGASAVHLIRR